MIFCTNQLISTSDSFALKLPKLKLYLTHSVIFRPKKRHTSGLGRAIYTPGWAHPNLEFENPRLCLSHAHVSAQHELDGVPNRLP